VAQQEGILFPQLDNTLCFSEIKDLELEKILYINDQETFPKLIAVLKIPNLLIRGRAKHDPLWRPSAFMCKMLEATINNWDISELGATARSGRRCNDMTMMTV
jgi:hypothetical protein